MKTKIGQLKIGQKVWVLFDMMPQEVVFLGYEYKDNPYFESGGRMANNPSRRMSVRYPDGTIRNVKYIFHSLDGMLRFLKNNAVYQKEEAA